MIEECLVQLVREEGRIRVLGYRDHSNAATVGMGGPGRSEDRRNNSHHPGRKTGRHSLTIGHLCRGGPNRARCGVGYVAWKSHFRNPSNVMTCWTASRLAAWPR